MFRRWGHRGAWRGRRLSLALLMLGPIVCASAAAGQTPPREFMVMPFDEVAPSPPTSWLTEGSSMLLSDLLDRYSVLTVPRDARLRAFERLQLPPAATLSHATMIKVGQLVGATHLVIGSYHVEGDRLTVRARTVGLAEGRITPELVESGRLTELVDIYDRLGRRVHGNNPPALDRVPGTILGTATAFEAYAKGLVAASPAAERVLLEQAAKLAPADDRVKLALWSVHTDAGDHQRALAVASSVVAPSAQWRTARFLVARSQIELKRLDEAFATLQQMAKEARTPEVQNALGVVQIRRTATPQTGRAVYYFNQAAQIDPAEPDYLFNLGYGYALDKDPAAAIYWLREAVRHNPTDGDAHLVLSAALLQSQATTEAARERELAERLGATPPRSGETVPRGLERLKDYAGRSRRPVESAIVSAGQRDQNELAAFHLDNARRAFDREADRDAERELRRALYLSPYLSEAHLLLGRVHLRNGRVNEAIQALKIALWSEDSAGGHVALAEAYVASQNLPAAREAIDRALQIDPASAAARSLRAKISP